MMPVWRGAHRPGRFDERLGPERDHLAANDAGHRQPVDRADDEVKDRDPADAVLREPGLDVFLAEDREQKDHDEDERYRVEDVDEPHHDVVDPAADVAGDRAVGDADHERHGGRDDADDERDARAPEDARQHVAAEFVAAADRSELPLAEDLDAGRTIARLSAAELREAGVAIGPLDGGRIRTVRLRVRCVASRAKLFCHSGLSCGGGVLVRRVDRVGRLQRQERREERQRRNRNEQPKAEHRDAILAQPPPGVFAERDAGIRFARLRAAARRPVSGRLACMNRRRRRLPQVRNQSSSTRGSRTVYDRSTSIFIVNRITVYSSTQPIASV